MGLGVDPYLEALYTLYILYTIYRHGPILLTPPKAGKDRKGPTLPTYELEDPGPGQIMSNGFPMGPVLSAPALYIAHIIGTCWGPD